MPENNLNRIILIIIYKVVKSVTDYRYLQSVDGNSRLDILYYSVGFKAMQTF